MATELNIPLFEALNASDREAVVALAERKPYADGEAIVEEGSPGRGVYILASGRVVVEKATIAGVAEVLTDLHVGECFGELALVDNKPRSATVRARGEAEVLVFDQSTLEAFLEDHPEIHRCILRNLARISAERLRRIDETLVQTGYDCIIVIDAACRILERRKVTARGDLIALAGRGEEFVGRDLLEAAPGLGEGVRRQLVDAVKAGRREVFVLDYPVAGETRHLEMTVSPEDADCAALGIRDISEQKALENRLIQSEKLAMTGQMASEIGHELRNHLTVLIGHVDLLGMVEEVASSDRAKRSVDIVGGQKSKKIERFASGLMESALSV